MTARIKALEKHYQVKLLTRTTRSLTLTDEGREFYNDCLAIIDDVTRAETKLKSGKDSLSGPLRITAPSDLGQQHVCKIIADFVQAHPKISPYLQLTDAITNLTENGLDLGIRYGVSNDNSLIAKKLASNWRVIVASPDYIKANGTPKRIVDLHQHQCLTMVRHRVPLTTWYFDTANGEQSIQISPARSSNDGAMIRRWAIEGAGIALKSIWDVIEDLKASRLVTVLDKYTHDYQSKDISRGTDMYLVYPSRDFLPHRTRSFIESLAQYFSEYNLEI